MSSEAGNIVINPVNVTWSIEAEELYDYTGITAASLDGVYSTLSSAKDATSYYLWYDLDGASVDPAPGGTGIEVDVVTGDSPAVIAGKVQAVLDALGDFSAVVEDSVKVRNIRTAVGEVTAAADVDSNVLITLCRNGKDFDLGLLQGDVEPNFAPANFVINAHQNGLTPLGLIGQGFDTIEVSTVMQETTRSKLKELYKIYGGVFTPGGGTEVFGAGTAVVGKNLLVDAARLKFSSVNTLDSEKSYDFTIMSAVPVPDTLTFSGENPRVLNVTWQGFADLSKDSRVNVIAIGDATQDGI